MSMLTAMPRAACDQGGPRPQPARAPDYLRGPRLGPDHADTKRSREHLAAVVAALKNRQ
jgi:hypothetical protein